MRGVSSGQVVAGSRAGQGWWLVVPEMDGPGRIVEGPFADRAGADWAAGAHAFRSGDGVRPVYGLRRADGSLSRRPSPQDWTWLAHLGEQLDRLPEDWDAGLPEDDPVITLMVEVTAALAEAGLPVYDFAGPDSALGGVCLTPEPGLSGIVVTWRQHDRMSVDEVHGLEARGAVQQVMNRALAEVLEVRGFAAEPFGDAGGHLVL